MKSILNNNDVYEAAELAHIYISDEDLSEHTKRLNKKMARVEKIQKIEPKTNKTTTSPTRLNTVLRKDEEKPGLSREEALSNAPDEFEGMFRVPRII